MIIRIEGISLRKLLKFMIDITIVNSISKFIFLQSKLQKADLIIVAGSGSAKVPLKAAFLYKKRFADKIIFTGGLNEKLKMYESKFMINIALKNGVRKDDIYSDIRSTNTRENAIQAKKIIRKNKLKYAKIIIIGLAYHTLRLKMTFAKVFPKSELLVISPKGELIRKDNWWISEYGRTRVLAEVEKIGKYYVKGDLSL
jgi:uncharacterized SAM-binding protein YcdF (DUF218 family)